MLFGMLNYSRLACKKTNSCEPETKQGNVLIGSASLFRIPPPMLIHFLMKALNMISAPERPSYYDIVEVKHGLRDIASYDQRDGLEKIILKF